MKKCANCNREYDDNKAFCPVCGNSLIPAANAGEGKMTSASGMNGNQNSSGQVGGTTGSPWYAQWAGTILAVLGLVIEWEISVLIGAALIIVGFILAKDSPVQTNKIVATVLLVIGLILLVLTMFS